MDVLEFKEWFWNIWISEATANATNPPNCPLCGATMVLRSRRSDGNQFYGCSNFPRCKGTMGCKNPNQPTQTSRQQVAPRPQSQQNPKQPEPPKKNDEWVCAKVIKPGHHLPLNKEIALRRMPNDDWQYVVIDPRYTQKIGIIGKNEVKDVIQSLKIEDKHVKISKPTLREFSKRFPKEVKQKTREIPFEQLSEEQQKIDKRFNEMLLGNKVNHMMISALAGTGKTTTLKHLAWKYGNPNQKWLYLVFNTKNKVEATESFPPFVKVKTTNGFLGEIIGGEVNGTEANVKKIPQTSRMVELSDKGDEHKIEKIRILADSNDFARLMVSLGIPNAVDISNYDIKMAKTLNSLLKSIKYSFKEQAITLSGLAKSYNVDPRDKERMLDKLSDILDDYDFDTQLDDVKERINKYSLFYRRQVINALNNSFKYDFMSKDFKDEIKQSTAWFLKESMPTATSQTYNKKGTDYHLGEFRDYNDDLWYASVHADEITWPHYDVVLADEVQDFNEAQKIMLKKLAEAGAKIIAVGDKNQCHPEDTVIALTGGKTKLISEIVPGDELVTYNSKKSYFPGTNTQGRKVCEVNKRQYSGEMITIKTKSNKQRCTPNHKCIVRFNADNKYCLYLMVKGEVGRIGICRLNYVNGFGLPIRAKQEGAEKAWLLGVFKTEQEARIAECVTAYKYGVPKLIFTNNGQKNPTQYFVNEVYKQIGNNIQNIKNCLKDFGRLWEFPLWTKEKQIRFGKMKQNYICSKKSFVTQSCNLITDTMFVRSFDGTPRGGEWESITVTRNHFEGDVYSLSVEPTEDGKKLYIADNIVTHNSIYRFRGADADAFDNLAKSLSQWSHDKNVTYTLSKNFRSKQAILDKSNADTHVKGLVRGKDYDEQGVVTHGTMKYDDAFSELKKEMDVVGEVRQTAFIARTNEPLVHAALKLMANNVPFQILGKDIAGDLKKHIKKITNMFNVDDNKHCNELADKLQEFENKENDTHHGKSTKRAYLEGIREVTAALLASIDQFMSENQNGNVRGFKEWIGKKLRGLDIDENEKDLKEYRKKVEEENPVILTTAHRSKGLEFSRVYLLRYDQFPHPKAQRPKDLTQEENARYVAMTRAQDELHILDLNDQPGYK